MFTICTDFVAEGEFDETLEQMILSEKNFTSEIGVLSRRFFLCTSQSRVIWFLTEWESEIHYNNAVQSIMKTRHDNRIGYQIFCNEDKKLGVGEFSDDLSHIVIAHGLMNTQAKESSLKLQENWVAKQAGKLSWLRIYRNSYNPDELVVFLGLVDEDVSNQVRSVGDFLQEEYLFSGLRTPNGMSFLASYNLFICTPLLLAGI